MAPGRDVRAAAVIRSPSPAPSTVTGALVLLVALGRLSMGCDEATPAAVIRSVTPSIGYSDLPLTLTVDAPSLRPALSIDVGGSSLAIDDNSIKVSLIPDSDDGRPSVSLGPPRWDGADTYLVTVPPRLAPGGYGLRIIPPSGGAVTFAEAFQALGPDREPPTLILESPRAGDTLVTGASTSLAFSVDDGAGELAAVNWRTTDGMTGACDLPVDALTGAQPSSISSPSMQCSAAFRAPSLTQTSDVTLPFSLTLIVVDRAGNQTTDEIPLAASERPTIASFTSTVGALAGHQPFVVRGHYFLPDSQAFFVSPDPQATGAPIPIVGSMGRVGGDILDDTSISGLTPQHDRAEPLIVRVVSPAGSGDAAQKFTYIGPPRPREIEPATGPTGGGVLVTVRGNDLRAGVTISFGPTLDQSRPLGAPISYAAGNKVIGCLPPGTGTVTVWAHDSITGDDHLAGAFTYQDGASSPATPPDPACQGAAP